MSNKSPDRDNEKLNEEDVKQNEISEDSENKDKKNPLIDSYTEHLIRLLTEPNYNITKKSQTRSENTKKNISLPKINTTFTSTRNDNNNNIKLLTNKTSSGNNSFIPSYTKNYLTKPFSLKKNKKNLKETESKEKNIIKLFAENYLTKEIKIRSNSKEKVIRSQLNRLYGHNKKFNKINKELKKPHEDNLDDHQQNILQLSSMNLSNDNMVKLISDLKSLRMNSELTKPLPPINYKALVLHSVDEVAKKNKKKVYGINLKEKKLSDMDEYEKEMYMIRINGRHKKIESTNKRLFKLYDILPEYVVEAVFKKKKKID